MIETKVKFFVRKFDGSMFGECQHLYDLPENNLAADDEDAFQKAIFAFEDGGSAVERKGMWFTTSDGDEYKVFTEPNDADDDESDC